MDGRRVTSIEFLWLVVLILLIANAPMWGMGDTRNPPHRSGSSWNVFDHEGDVKYYLRVDSVLCIIELDASDAQKLGYHTEIVLSNGRSIYTKLGVHDVFGKLEGVSINEVLNTGGD